MSDVKGVRELLERARRRFQAARGEGSTVQAEAAIELFGAAMAAGAEAEALGALDEGIGAARRGGRRDEESVLLGGRALLARASGDLERAGKLLAEAEPWIPDLPPFAARLLLREIGELALTRRRWSAAEQAFDRARHVEELPVEQAFLLIDRQATAAREAGKTEEVIELFHEAERMALRAGDSQHARLARLSKASLWSLRERWGEACAALDALEVDASAAGDHGMLAATYLLRSHCRQRTQGSGVALADALAARQSALRAVDPLSYIKASTLLVSLYDRTGERVHALEAFLTGRATLGDLLGSERADAMFAKCDQEMRQRWGADYADVERAYARKQASGSVPP